MTCTEDAALLPVPPMRAAPPSCRPVPGKRRPRPVSVGCARSCTVEEIVQTTTPAKANTSALEEEVISLRSLVAELSERLAASLPQTATAAAQTEPLRPSTPEVTRSSSPTVGEEEQRRQLDALHKEAGEKGRELRKVHETVRLLRSELQHQQLLAEQYRTQVEVLEEQLKAAMHQRRQLVDEALTAETPGRVGSRPSSAGAARSCGTASNSPMSIVPRPTSATGRRHQGWLEDDDDDDLSSSESPQPACGRVRAAQSARR